VCLDEKPVTLHAEVRPASPARPGREARRDGEYERCGTAQFGVLEFPGSRPGEHLTAVHQRDFQLTIVPLVRPNPHQAYGWLGFESASVNDHFASFFTLRHVRRPSSRRLSNS
jgi:hypothetical protein